MIKITPTIVFLSLIGTTAFGQQQQPLTPEETAALRQLLVQDQVNSRNTPDEVEAVRKSRLEEERANASRGYGNSTRRILQNQEIEIISDGKIVPYPILPLKLWQGTTSAISFYDLEGTPWPIESISFDKKMLSVNGSSCDDLGAVGSASDSDAVQGSRNILNLTPCNFWTTASVQVVLSGETKPIVFDISSGSEGEQVFVDANASVAVQSAIERPFGRNVAGKVDLGWIQPQARTMNIDPIDTTNDKRANAISLARDVTTDISFMDRSRSPWPIHEVVFTRGIVAINGECADEIGGLETYAPKDDDVSTFWATLCEPTRATIGVKLKGRAGAISLLVLDANGPSRQPDGTLTIRVTGTAPSTGPTSPGEAAMASAPRTVEAFVPDAALDDFLAGAPLEGSYPAKIAGGGGNVQGWVYDNALYLRGPFFVVNPAYDGMARSTDGTTRVYKFEPPVSRLLVSSSSGAEAVLNVAY